MRWLSAFVLAGLVTAQTAPEVAFEVRVRAGDVPRSGSPVVAVFPWPGELVDALDAAQRDAPTPWPATLTADGGDVPCDVVAIPARAAADARGELRFVLDRLDAGGERTFRLRLGSTPLPTADRPFSVTTLDSARELAFDAKPVLRHEHEFDPLDRERTNRPEWHLLLPGTGVQLTKGAGGKFPHQRGLFLAWNKTGVGDATFDYWHGTGVAQRHTGYDLTREVQSAVRGELATATHWLGPIDEPIVRERRTLTAWRPACGAASSPWIIDVAIELAADRLVTLRGDPHHAGFQIRVADEVAEREDARYLRPPSAHGGKDDVWHDCPWVVGLFTIEGREVAIAHLSHPENPKPLVYATRPYGRFGACFDADLTADAPLHLRYRLILVPVGEDTDLGVERFARTYADYAHPVEVEVRRAAR